MKLSTFWTATEFRGREALLRHPGVAEVSVIGRTHPEWEEVVVAFVVARPGATPGEAELDALCREQIARFKRPKAYRFVTAPPEEQLRQGAQDRVARD